MEETMQSCKLRLAALLAGLVMLVVGALPCQAAEDIQIISTAQLKKWLESGTKPLLVYTLSQVEFYEQRIPGSVCIPTEEMRSSRELPQKRDTPVVFYCHGPG
jgi:hypothetical protein